MTYWLINDLSLAGQYGGPEEFWIDLEAILATRQSIAELADRLLCSASLKTRQATSNHSLLEAVYTVDGPRRYLALRWLTKGPFWEQSRQQVPIDIFDYKGTDVTDLGLGEVARRLLTLQDAKTLSFPGVPEFQVSPLSVEHIREDDTIGTIEIENFWDITTFRNQATTSQPERDRWRTIVETAQNSFRYLLIPIPAVVAQLSPYPFDDTVAKRIVQLLDILNQIATTRAEKGDGSSELTQLLNLYFVGDRALFSDESDKNKDMFSAEMTFEDPASTSEKLFCTWHGKVRTELPYRIHFQWPIPKGQKLLKVPYIGPKITRR